MSLLVVMTAIGCGKGNSGSLVGGGSFANVTTPTPGATTIEIRGQQGANSFSPNPASVTQGAMVLWHNGDSSTHHIVLNDNSLDTGLIQPGASSTAMALIPSGAQYHRVIHPTMVGSINVPTNAPPVVGRY